MSGVISTVISKWRESISGTPVVAAARPGYTISPRSAAGRGERCPGNAGTAVNSGDRRRPGLRDHGQHVVPGDQRPVLLGHLAVPANLAVLGARARVDLLAGQPHAEDVTG